ncbi:Hypothetical predicted protein [Cloeon dipterum]|uniref:Uncharacterized protein n=1 Tax=Cloeon dipterum TaxID=197152 RepID=A0A8S1CG82_9INSE|nr:Hypothetical predicted protein [Cloeon dipterum]
MKSLFLILITVLSLAKAQNDSATDCASLDFKSLPKTCCNQPYGDLFPSSKLSGLKECKSTSALLEWANSYKLNSLQSKDIKNFIDEKSKSFTSTICAPAIFMNCLFKANSFLNTTGHIDIENLSSFLATNAPNDTWRNIVSSTLDPMYPSSSTAYLFTDIVEDNFEKVTCPSETVNLLPLIMTQMLQSEFIWMCPKQNLYTNTNKCSITMKNFQYCDGKVYSSTAKGIFFFPYV